MIKKFAQYVALIATLATASCAKVEEPRVITPASGYTSFSTVTKTGRGALLSLDSQTKTYDTLGLEGDQRRVFPTETFFGYSGVAFNENLEKAVTIGDEDGIDYFKVEHVHHDQGKYTKFEDLKIAYQGGMQSFQLSEHSFSPGDHHLRITVIDTLGNIRKGSLEFTIDQNRRFTTNAPNMGIVYKGDRIGYKK